MKVELLYFDGCPGYERARWALEDALAQEDIRADMETISVDTDEAARKHRFPGSPTIRIEGLDLFPVERLGSKPEWHLGGCIAYQERPRWNLCCRLYQTPDGQKDHPTTEMIRKRLIDRQPKISRNWTFINRWVASIHRIAAKSLLGNSYTRP